MFSYTWDGHQIALTNGEDISLVQPFDPSNGEFFASEEEAVAWGNKYIATLGSIDVLISPLDSLKASKSDNTKQLYQDALNLGFDSDADGNGTHYAYDEMGYEKFNKLFVLRANNMVQYPVPIYDSKNQLHTFDNDQLTALLTDISKFEWGAQLKLHDFLSKIIACETEDDLNNLEINFN